MKLSQLKVGEGGMILKINHKEYAGRLAEFGIFSGSLIFVTLKAPFNGPLAIISGETHLSIRAAEAQYIDIELQK